MFARVAGSGAAGGEFDCPLLVSVAGLVDAHRRLAAARPSWEDVVVTWSPDELGSDRPELDPAEDPFIEIWEDVQRHILAIDLEAHRVLGEPDIGAMEHYEGLGAVFGRMAHLYTISFDRFVLDGPQAPNRRQLARAYISYEALARELVCGKRRLPPLSGRPRADDIGG
ncbi:hypothetical protein [Nocardia sp. NBC_01329]|uniref:hypothetical protein n=1 Tax=Nocardia sp. NBC_01329 TaxID=2903594 RepID=UPI002E14CF64|nr:hypothetical protein OG405_03890 [Nocardia sp. NBC_01329]